MPSEKKKPLGILKPLGGGDPIPLRKEEMIVGRRPTNDVRLDFENISGKHCVLKLIKGVWHVRDLDSTNGTTVNGQRITSEHGIMPDDELGIATHYFSIDYDPVAPILNSKQVLEEELPSETRKHRSLLELAGMAYSSDRPSRAPRPSKREREFRPPANDPVFEDPLPERFKTAPAPKKVDANDDDFFKLIEEDVKGGK